MAAVTAIEEATATQTGISFALTDEQRELRRLAREFAEKEIRPKAAEYDEDQTHPADVVAKAHEVGLMNPHIPEEYGGLGLPGFDGMLVGEELSWGCAGIAVSIIANTLGSAPVMLSGSDDQKAKWLPPLVEEPILCSFGLTEPNAGSDVSGIGTTAVRHGDEYVINGSKMFITNAGHADWLVVFASTDKSKGHKGLSAFVVPTDLDGVVVEKHLDKMGQRATDTSAIAFGDVKVPAENRIGEEGEGFKIAMKTLDFTRPGTAAGAVGVAQAAFDYSVEYAKTRVQFGQPIAMNQGINFLVADMLVESDESAAERYGPLAQAAAARGLVMTEATAEQIRKLGRRSLALKCDVTDEEQVEAAVSQTVEELGSVDILVNNAGTLDHLGQLVDQSPELWERDLRVNLTGAFNCSRAVWPHMKERGWGRIVNMASVAGTLGGFGQASYSTTKAGLIGLTKTLALEGARYGITANAIVPGIIGTEAFDFGNPEMNKRMIQRTALRRTGKPEDIANAIAFLCSDLAGYITGVELNVSGGVELFTF